MDALREGQKVWVEQARRLQRAGIFVGEAEATWFGAPAVPTVVYPDTRSGEEVAIMRIVPARGVRLAPRWCRGRAMAGQDRTCEGRANAFTAHPVLTAPEPRRGRSRV